MPASKVNDEWTVISYDVNESTNALLNALSSARLKWDICANSPFPLIDIGKAEIKEAYYDLKKRGIKSKMDYRHHQR